MFSPVLVRTTAVAAIAGAAGHITATLLEPDWSSAPSTTMPTLAGSTVWTGDRLLDLASLLATVFALAVFAHLFTDRARTLIRAGQPFLILLATLGSAAILVETTLQTLARDGAPGTPDYVAAFTATAETASALFFGAFLAMGLYLAFFAAAILAGSAFPRWIGRALVVAATCLILGDLLMLGHDAGFLVVLAGFGLANLLLIALGVAAWRTTTRPDSHRQPAMSGG